MSNDNCIDKNYIDTNDIDNNDIDNNDIDNNDIDNNDNYIIICDPRHSHLMYKNKWEIIREFNENELIIEYQYNEKPEFISEICKTFFPEIKTLKPHKKLYSRIFNIFNEDIIDIIITFLPERYITTVEKRFCRNLDKKWKFYKNANNEVFDNEDRCFYNKEYNTSSKNILSWKWSGGDETCYNIGWFPFYG